jgi:hypothetical protein
VCCDHLINTDSYVDVGVFVGNRSHRHDADSQKIGRHNRMLSTCRDDISDKSATDKNVCCLRGVADRHICPHCQPSRQRCCYCHHRLPCQLRLLPLLKQWQHSGGAARHSGLWQGAVATAVDSRMSSLTPVFLAF